MNDILFEQIERYSQGEMGEAEKELFEKELFLHDELSAACKLYSGIESERRSREKYRAEEIALKNTLHGLNRKYFTSQTNEPAKIIAMPSRKYYRLGAAIAACFLLVIAGYLFLMQPKNDVRQLAANYTKENFSTLSLTMDASRDSLQLGLAAFNDKQYDKAVELFKSVYQKNSSNSDAVKYTGIVYLVTNDYDKALQYFQQLSQLKGLFSNPGKFYQAITLLQRNGKGDSEQAKLLLQQVVAEKLEGSQEAEEWLKKL